jgi:hypothetical protein
MVTCLYFCHKKKQNQPSNVNIDLHDLNVTYQHENETTGCNNKTDNQTQKRGSNTEILNLVREFIMANTRYHLEKLQNN